MKIGIILHPYGEDSPAGLARVIFEFIKGMLEIDAENEYIIFLKNKPKKEPDLPGKNWRVESLGGGRFWLEQLRHATQVDVCIFNTPVMPLFYRPKKSIVIALDFGYYYLGWKTIRGSLRDLATLLYHIFSLWWADHIVAISEATKKDTVKIARVRPEKITVVHLGYKKICATPEIPRALPEKFFLFVGIIKERKNVFNIVRAFNIVQKKHPGYHFAIGGKGTGRYFDDLLAYISREKLSEKIVFLGHLNDGQQSYIYKQAIALVFPTFIEGFGMPVLEAMDCGVPVITSNQSSLAEVAGDAALLVDPHSPEAIAAAMERLIVEPALRAELISRGRKRTADFSWRLSAQKLLAVVNRVGNSPAA